MIADQTIMQNLTLEKTLETIPSGVFVVNDAKQILYWNPTAERITGYSAAEVLGQHCSVLQGVPCGELCGLFGSETPKPILGANCTIVTRSGETIYLLKNMEYLRDAQDNIIGGIESFIDITRQHSLEESLRNQAMELESRVDERTRELKKSEARFRTMLDNMDDLAYIATADYRLTFMNRTMQGLFGDRTGACCYQILHGEAKPCLWCPMDKVFRNRTVRDERNLADRNHRGHVGRQQGGSVLKQQVGGDQQQGGCGGGCVGSFFSRVNLVRFCDMQGRIMTTAPAAVEDEFHVLCFSSFFTQ